MKEIYKKLMNIQAELRCPKSEFNKFGNYYHRNLESVYEALKPLLKAHKCCYVVDNEVSLIGEHHYRKGTARLICVETGEQLTVTTSTRESFDKRGMSSEQMSGSTASYNDKYLAGKMFLIDDAKDADSTNTHGQDQASTQAQAQTTGKNVGAKASDKQIKLAKFLRDKTDAKVSDAQIMSLDAANMSKFIDKLSAKKKELEGGAITTDDIPFD